MGEEIHSAIDFYNQHPISAEIVLAKLQQSRGHLDGLTPDDLLEHDQDHYGGTGATDALARLAHIGEGTRVADFCAGLGASARYLAHRYGADVTGIELTPARVAGAADLTRRVGLQDRVRVIEGNVMQVPLPDASMDAVISQEAFLHVPDNARTLAEAYRILKPGGRVAFTTWVAPHPLSAADRDLMWRGMAVASLHSLDEYGDLLQRAGFTVQSVEPDRRVGRDTDAAARHVSQAALASAGGRHGGGARRLLRVLRSFRGSGDQGRAWRRAVRCEQGAIAQDRDRSTPANGAIAVAIAPYELRAIRTSPRSRQPG